MFWCVSITFSLAFHEICLMSGILDLIIQIFKGKLEEVKTTKTKYVIAEFIYTNKNIPFESNPNPFESTRAMIKPTSTVCPAALAGRERFIIIIYNITDSPNNLHILSLIYIFILKYIECG